MEAPFTLATLMDLSGSGRSLASAIQSRWRKPLGRSRESCSAKHCNVRQVFDCRELYCLFGTFQPPNYLCLALLMS
jgi:hypothetical protein